MQKIISVLLLAGLCALATGCGVKGPLYFPEKQPADQQQNNQK